MHVFCMASALHHTSFLTTRLAFKLRGLVLSIRKVHPHCLTYVEKIFNVSRYEFASIAVYKLVGL